MNTYRDFATHLGQLLDGHSAVHITVSGFMPLSVDEIGIDGEGHRLLSLCHYGEQNGDLMRDPDLVFMFQDAPYGFIAEPVSFRNDYLGLDQEVYRYDEAGTRTEVCHQLKQSLKDFAQTWFANLVLCPNWHRCWNLIILLKNGSFSVSPAPLPPGLFSSILNRGLSSILSSRRFRTCRNIRSPFDCSCVCSMLRRSSSY